ncbi:unnamed protein product [Linum tenue]|uniref:Initiator tRNA phosphoribosyl transferase family protein n=1 Tax=Linum tenue TaxID=586396 RepID=A0AAV0QGZ6_9ROSI|nr:unnamed protein product [Linum tenue]
MDTDGRALSIYRAARTIKRKDNSLYNALRSIYEDSIFVGEISQLWPELPLLANLRCGLWYSRGFAATCYFKSTDGHTNNCSFSTARLNLHVAALAGQKGGCMIVDSTRKGKRFPDSMSKTIPIWTCVLNRAIRNYVCRVQREAEEKGETADVECTASLDWDCSLHLPLWVPGTEKAAIEERIDEWVEQLEASGADIASLASCLKKPLRPLWVSQKTVIWLNEVPDHDSWDFTAVMLVSASAQNGVFQQHRTTSEFSWNYIPGAGDDEESWARGLSPGLFWNHAYDIIGSGPEMCNQKVAEIVEKDRVYRAQRGQDAPQICLKNPKASGDTDRCSSCTSIDSPGGDSMAVFRIGFTNVAVGSIQHAASVPDVDCILNCDEAHVHGRVANTEDYLHLPMVSSKWDRFSLSSNLPAAVNFAKAHLNKGRSLLVCCQNGEDISVCVCLAIVTSLFDEEGYFDDGRLFAQKGITKWEMRRRLVFLCKFAVTARPSRGNLKQVYGFLSQGRAASSDFD